jgi:dihydroflavonol-4-reductase
MIGTALVTGGSGYIAGFLIRQLIENGWTVHTTVRSLSREQEVRNSLGLDNSKLRFFAADLEQDNGWADAMEGVSHVAHVASPFPLAVPKNPDELIVPAREGALRALRFAKAAGVRRIVLTSSMAAVAYGHDDGERIYTAADWTNVDHIEVSPYAKSKTLAERAARNWVAAQGGDMEFVSICPAAVFGPLLSDDISTSTVVVQAMLEGKVPACPDVSVGIVDVRDVADLHFRALTALDIGGARYLCTGPCLPLIEIANILRADLGDKAAKVPKRKIPSVLIRGLALFVRAARPLAAELGRNRTGDSSPAMNALGWTMRTPRESLIATANDLIARGIVKTP